MRSLFITAAVVTAASALCGCPYHKQQPLPGPQSSVTLSLPASGARHEAKYGGSDERPPEIRWFQGTLDEAFSRRPCTEDHPQFRH
jgi:hypothetical protein